MCLVIVIGNSQSRLILDCFKIFAGFFGYGRFASVRGMCLTSSCLVLILSSVKPNTHCRRRRDETVESRLVASRRRCVHEFATSSRRLPTDSVDNLETG